MVQTNKLETIFTLHSQVNLEKHERSEKENHPSLSSVFPLIWNFCQLSYDSTKYEKKDHWTR